MKALGLPFHFLTFLETPQHAHTAGPEKADPHLKQVRPREGEGPNRDQTLFQGDLRPFHYRVPPSPTVPVW